MRKLRLLFASAFALLAWTGVSAQTDAEIDAANAAIENGAAYRITATFGGEKYYLKTDGYLTADLAQAPAFTFNLASGGTFKPGKGYKTGQFTNGGDNVNNITGESLNHIIVGKNNRDDFEGQVWYMNAEGDFAVRSTNSNSGGWAASAFWSVVGDNDGDGLPNATYTTEDVPYIWNIELDESAIAYNIVQTWPAKLQTSEGLVTNAGQWSSNAKESTEGSFEALLDNKYETFFHSQWSGTGPEEDHYLQAELPNAVDKFFFYFQKRSQNNNNRPTEIKIFASNDGAEFVEITSIQQGLPTDAAKLTYLSDAINLGAKYKYIRFTVPSTNNGAQNNGHVFFTFSEFYILPVTNAIQQALDYVSSITSKNDIDAELAAQIVELDETITAQAALKANRRALEAALVTAKEITAEQLPAASFDALQKDIKAYENNNFTTAQQYEAATQKLQGYFDLKDAYVEYVATVQSTNALDGKIPAAAFEAAQNAIVDPTTVEECNAATAVLKEYAALAMPYEAYKRMADHAKEVASYLATSAADKVMKAVGKQDAAVEDALTADAIMACTASLGKDVDEQMTDITEGIIVNPNPVNNAEGWTCSEQPNHFDAPNNVAEFWNLSAATVKQTISLPAGIYCLTVTAHQRTGMSGTIEANGVTRLIAEVGSDVANNRTQSNAWFNAGYGLNWVVFELAQAQDVTIGINVDAATGDHWTVFRSFRLNALGDAALIISKQQYEKALAAAKSYQSATMFDYSKKLLNNVIAENTLGANATAQAYHDAIPVLNEAAATAEKRVNNYQADYALYTAVKQAVAGQATAELTEHVVNAGFETGNLTGWISVAGESAFNNEVATNKNFSLLGGEYFYERWKGGVALSTGSLAHEDIFLPAGHYLIKADAQNIEQYNNNAAGKGFYLCANGEKTAIGRADNYFVTVSLSEGEPLTIQFLLDGCSGNWICCDNVTLTFAATDEDLKTSVRGIETPATQQGAVFNLAGQRVGKAVKGIYIVGGKKVVVK